MKAFVESQLGYCPLVCPAAEVKIVAVLRINFSDHSSTFKNLLVIDNSVYNSILHRNTRLLATELS